MSNVKLAGMIEADEKYNVTLAAKIEVVRIRIDELCKSRHS